MKNLLISIQTFENIIERDMVYVDKTKYIFPLVSKGKYYFLARPRRFGKSLLLTTLKSFFQGKKELFKGLYIYAKEKDWTVYPVVHIDYSKVNYKDTFATNTKLKQVFTLSRRAMKQIKDKKYYEAYLSDSRKILLLGLGFLNKQLHGRVEELSV